MRVTAIKCAACSKLHDLDAGTFVTVKGNIYMGEHAGLVGNYVEDGKGSEPVAYCHPHCIAKLLNLKISVSR